MILISTAVAPVWRHGQLRIDPIRADDLPDMLRQVVENLHGHAPTVEVLRGLCPSLPEPRKGFWDGQGTALAVRIKGGIRVGQGDLQVALTDLEAALVRWIPDEG